MFRRTMVVFVVLASSTLSASAVWAHSDEGEMTVTRTEQIGPNLVHVEVGIVYSNDNDIADEATVSATLTGPDGTTVGPVALPELTGSLYGADIEVSSLGTWDVAVSSTAPTASAAAVIPVADTPASTTTKSTAAATTTLAAPQTDSDSSSSSTGLIVAVVAGVLVLVAGGMVLVMRGRSSRT